MDTHFLVDALHVGSNRVVGDEQLLGDEWLAVPLGDIQHDFGLAFREPMRLGERKASLLVVLAARQRHGVTRIVEVVKQQTGSMAFWPKEGNDD